MTSLTSFSVLSTRWKWCGRASLLIPYRHFVSKCLMVSGILCMLIMSLMRTLYRQKPPIPRHDVLQNNMAGCTMYSALELVDGYYQLLCELVISRLQRLVTKWYALEFAGYAPETFKCPGHIQSSGDTSVSPSLSSCTNIL